jgi:uncharacterized delta-60 repeat protein
MTRLAINAPRYSVHSIACMAKRGALIVALGASLYLPATTVARPGDLDPSFSDDGLVAGLRLNEALDLAVQPDGKIVVLSRCRCDQFLVSRFNADGSLDQSFGRGGSATSNFHAPAQGNAVAIQPDGRIVVVGGSGPTYAETDLALARFTPNGSPDPGFGEGGQLTESFGDHAAGGHLAVQPDGRIVVSVLPRMLLSYLPSGERDASFSGDGVAELPGEAFDYVGSFVLQQDGRIVVVVGKRLVRLTGDGELDPSFGNGGLADPAPIGPSSGLGALALQSDRLLVGGTQMGLKGNSGILFGYTLEGKLDPSFAGDGFKSVGVPVYEIGVRSSGGVLLTGPAGGGTKTDFVLVGLRPRGDPDRRFGEVGLVRTNFEGNVDQASALAFSPDGRLVVGGRATVRASAIREAYPDRFDLGLARYELTFGSPDADADGRLDDRDRCELAFGTGQDGCPVHRRRLSLDYSAREGAFVGQLRSPYVACMTVLSEPGSRQRHRVELLARRPGPDRRVGVDRLSDADLGEYAVEASRPEGRFYARARSLRSPVAGICPPIRSRTLSLPGAG